MSYHAYQHMSDKHGSQVAKMTFGLRGSEAKFFKAIGENDVQALGNLLDKGMNVEVTNEVGMTGLVAAIESGHLGIIHILLQYGASFNTEFNGFSPIAFAVTFHGRRDIVELLLRYGNIREGESIAMHYACDYGHLELVKLFLQRGADIYKFNELGGTMLHSAATGGNPHIVGMFLGKFNPHATDNTGKTALDCARASGNQEVVRLIASRC